MESKEVMKYYLIYEQLFANDGFSTIAARCFSIVEHEEVAKDFCRKHCGCYYEEVKIENDKEELEND